MPDTIDKVKYAATLRVKQVLDVALDGVTNQEHVLEIADLAGEILSNDKDMPCTSAYIDQRSLTAGADSLDLTALVRTNLDNLDWTGLKVRFVAVYGASTNTGVIVVFQSASGTPYYFADSSFAWHIVPGGWTLWHSPESTIQPDVSATVKDIDFGSADVDAAYTILMVAG